jgi:hypothetical protein
MEMINELRQLISENKGETELKFLFLDTMTNISANVLKDHPVRLNNEFISYLEDHRLLILKLINYIWPLHKQLLIINIWHLK